jgi:two-component system nitrogen regulation response regulator GlnG
MPTLLIVDDEPAFCYSFRRVFGTDGVEVLTAATVAEGVRVFRDRMPDVVVLDLQLPDGSGLEVFEAVRAASPRRPVIFLTAHGTAQTAIEAMKHGAFDYLTKPADFDRLSELLRRAFEAARLMRVPALLPELEPVEQIVGRSPAIQEVCKAVGRVAGADVNVLVTGESGVGKELVARAIYHHSRRSDKPFLAVNCAALPEGLVESELFGHEKGAFTGADRQRVGKFEQCDGGALFLDEIGDMPPGAQAKVLRVLQEQRFERVGGTETVHTDVRVIAATNADLGRRIAEGRFRADLYYRLRGVQIDVPPLRDRPDDVPELAHHFLFAFDRELGLNVQGFDAEALALLRQYRWPGNVRELQSAVKEAMLRAAGPIVMPDHLPPALRSAAEPTEPAKSEGPLDVPALVEGLIRSGEGELYAKVVREVERYLLARVLGETRGHQAQASERLGLHRSTLRFKLRDLGLSVERSVGPQEPPTDDPAG